MKNNAATLRRAERNSLSTREGVVQFGCGSTIGPLPVAMPRHGTFPGRACDLRPRDVVMVPHPAREVGATPKEVHHVQWERDSLLGSFATVVFSDATIWRLDSHTTPVPVVVLPDLWNA